MDKTDGGGGNGETASRCHRHMKLRRLGACARARVEVGPPLQRSQIAKRAILDLNGELEQYRVN